jgi:hypothetical protein
MISPPLRIPFSLACDDVWDRPKVPEVSCPDS